MDIRDHARFALHFSRRMLAGQLESFKSPEAWMLQVHPGANHALWITAHLALVDNSFISKFRLELSEKDESWVSLFGFASQPRSDASQYPRPEEVLDYSNQRRAALLGVLDELSDEEWNAPAPPPGAKSPLAGAPNMGHSFIFVSQHELLHAGQLSVARRALGHAPLLG